MPFDALPCPCGPTSLGPGQGPTNPPWNESLGAGSAARCPLPALHPLLRVWFLQICWVSLVNTESMHLCLGNRLWPHLYIKSRLACCGLDTAARQGDVYGICEDARECVGEVHIAASAASSESQEFGRSLTHITQPKGGKLNFRKGRHLHGTQSWNQRKRQSSCSSWASALTPGCRGKRH